MDPAFAPTSKPSSGLVQDQQQRRDCQHASDRDFLLVSADNIPPWMSSLRGAART
jgi:hypothetical protein